MGLGINDIIFGKRDLIIQAATNYGAENIRIFGSFARGDATEDSDIDFLAHFPQSDFFKRMDFKEYLESIFHKSVDLVSDKGLSPFIAPYILAEAKPI